MTTCSINLGDGNFVTAAVENVSHDQFLVTLAISVITVQRSGERYSKTTMEYSSKHYITISQSNIVMVDSAESSNNIIY